MPNFLATCDFWFWSCLWDGAILVSSAVMFILPSRCLRQKGKLNLITWQTNCVFALSSFRFSVVENQLVSIQWWCIFMQILKMFISFRLWNRHLFPGLRCIKMKMKCQPTSYTRHRQQMTFRHISVNMPWGCFSCFSQENAAINAKQSAALCRKQIFIWCFLVVARGIAAALSCIFVVLFKSARSP